MYEPCLAEVAPVVLVLEHLADTLSPCGRYGPPPRADIHDWFQHVQMHPPNGTRHIAYPFFTSATICRSIPCLLQPLKVSCKLQLARDIFSLESPTEHVPSKYSLRSASSTPKYLHSRANKSSGPSNPTSVVVPLRTDRTRSTICRASFTTFGMPPHSLT